MRMKKLTLVIVSLSIGLSVLGQDKPAGIWEKSLVGNLNLTQTAFDNWTSGGENSFAWQLNINYKFVKDLTKYNWANTGKLSYGNTKTGDGAILKSVDEIKLESIVSYKLGTAVNPYVAIDAESQLAKGYDYTITPTEEVSAFLDPAYFRESIGAGMSVRKGITTRLGAALKQTVTSNYPVPYADDPATPEIETLRSEIGVDSVTDINLQFSKTSQYVAKLELFSNLHALDEIDVNFDNILSVNISEYISTNFNLKIVYDKDVSTKRQIKQSIALGISYTFV